MKIINDLNLCTAPRCFVRIEIVGIYWLFKVCPIKQVCWIETICFVEINFTNIYWINYLRLCCGGHGYSAASGLSQVSLLLEVWLLTKSLIIYFKIIQEADAACTYEGDNVVLLLQTARYLLKCAQKDISPHLDLANMNELKSSPLYMRFNKYFDIFNTLYQE